jgi:RNA polymerase sigma-70 factor (ECF subfamily)
VIEDAVARLDSKYRTVFKLRDVEGFSIESTARMLELGVPAVKTRLHRARLHLRRELASYFGRQV